MTKVLFLLIGLATLLCGPVVAQTTFRVMEYNVENLFDTINNPEKDDDEFLPSGNRHWMGKRYYHKLRQISKAISAAGEWSTPALVALCEVENDSVVTHLLSRTPLRQQHYRYCMTHGSDTRGINTALLYQRDLFGYISHMEHPVVFSHENHKETRNILHVWGKIITTDTLDVFVCHFPSRYGGEKETEADRFDAARTLRLLCDSLLHVRTTPQILIMGDFNDTAENRSLTEVLSAGKITEAIDERRLYNLFATPMKDAPPGTHKYRGEWAQLDHIIVSGNLLSDKSAMHLISGSNKIFAPSFLFIEDKTHKGMRPLRTYNGFRYEGGFSDHLPLIADFILLSK